MLEHESSRTLEGRQLLANFSITYSATVPAQPTDYTAPISLPKFSPSLGTLTQVALSFNASGTQGGTLTNVADGPQSFSFDEDVNLALNQGESTLLAPDLVASQSYTNLAANGSAPFGPFTPTQGVSTVYTSGANFDLFAGGPGNVFLTVQTVTNQTITGGGGNIRAKVNTTAGGTATVVYSYSATPVTLAGNVYEDVRGTGALAPGDTPIPGTVLTLTGTSGTVVATTTTGADGTYSFTATTGGGPLPPGTYSIHETQPAGFLQGTNTVGTVDGMPVGMLVPVDTIGSIALFSGQDSIGNNFGEVLPVTISGTVYDDVLHTGSLQPGDLPIPGVGLALFGPSGQVATATTGPNGTYAFTTTASGAPLPPGTYTVVEFQPAGFLQGTNTVGTVNGVPVGMIVATDVIGGIALTSAQASVGNNFGELLPSASPSVTNVERFGVHLQPSLIVLAFDSPLNPATAQDVANYHIFGPTGSKHPAQVPIESATYNPAANIVTLRLGERLDVHHPYRLTVTGLEGSTGAPLIGSNGLPGGSYVTTLDRSKLAGFTDIYGNFIPINHGKLYPASIASGYQHKRFVAPANLGPFAAANRATFLAATAGAPEIPPIDHSRVKKAAIRLRHHG